MVGSGHPSRADVVMAVLASLLVLTATAGATALPSDAVVESTHSTDTDFSNGTFTGEAHVEGTGEDAYIVASSSETATFSYTGGRQTYTVPEGVSEVTVQLWGAGGGGGDTGASGGDGGYVEGTLPVTSGETLYVYVGGAGGGGSSSNVGNGGFNGGGDAGSGSTDGAGGGGGGATDVRQGGTTLDDRVAVAAGGGGAGAATRGGDETSGAHGGADTGGTANDAVQDGAFSYGGHGGTQSAGGDGGEDVHEGDPGSFGNGSAGSSYGDHAGGGGGGGGWYGGQGGGADTHDDNQGEVAGSGGGGGSNYDDGLSSVTSNSRGGGSSGGGSGSSGSNGQAKISYKVSGTGTYISAPHSVENSVSGFTNLTISSNSAIVTWEGWDGSQWTQLARTTYTTTGNHTATWSAFAGEKVRVNVTMTGGGVKLHDEGVSSTKQEAQETPEGTPTPDDDGGGGRSGDDDDDDRGGRSGGGGGGGGGDSGPIVEVTRESANQARIAVTEVSRLDRFTVRLPAMNGEAGDGTELTAIHVTSGMTSDFDVVARRTAEPPADTPGLQDATGQSGLAYFTLDHELTDDDVANARLTFRVEKATLEAWGAAPASVTVYRFEDDGWVGYDTRPVGEDDSAYYVSATFPGLSRFAVGADRTITPTATATTRPTSTRTVSEEAAGSGAEPPGDVPVESPAGFDLGLFVVAGLLAVLFAIGYLGGGSLYDRYENR